MKTPEELRTDISRASTGKPETRDFRIAMVLRELVDQVEHLHAEIATLKSAAVTPAPVFVRSDSGIIKSPTPACWANGAKV